MTEPTAQILEDPQKLAASGLARNGDTFERLAAQVGYGHAVGIWQEAWRTMRAAEAGDA